VLVNCTTGETLATHVVTCDTFWAKLRGLMFHRALGPSTAFVFAGHRESVAEATIHMFFVFFPIAVIWLDGQRRVVDTALARPFRPCYAPRRAARYFVEGVPALLEHVAVGDELAFGPDRGRV